MVQRIVFYSSASGYKYMFRLFHQDRWSESRSRSVCSILCAWSAGGRATGLRSD
jgi:hypothetical protein